MKQLCALTVLFLMAAAAGCSPITVNYDFDKDANLAVLKTFDWLPQPEAASKSVKEELERNSLLEKRVREAVAREMAAKGIEEVSKNPDFLVTYHTGVEDKVDVKDWGYTYAGIHRYRGGWGSRDVSVYKYREGTLILDFVDPKTHTLIWRGIAQAVLSRTENPEKRDKLVYEAVKKILEGFPPAPTP